MKTIILYRSYHHGNTKQLVDAIRAAHPEVDALDVATLGKKELPDLSTYHLIGFASGVYYGKLDNTIMRVVNEGLRDGDFVFSLITSGAAGTGLDEGIKDHCVIRRAAYLGGYSCLGFDTFGPFRLVGGIAKGHPTDDEVQGAVAFYEGLLEEHGEEVLAGRASRDRKDAYKAAHAKPGVLESLKGSVSKQRDGD